MRIKISYPNDCGSEDAAVTAMTEYGSEDEILRALADSAIGAGLQFESATDYGAIWRGTPAQIGRAIAALPAWAAHYYVEV